jgi:hypothetical protein
MINLVQYSSVASTGAIWVACFDVFTSSTATGKIATMSDGSIFLLFYSVTDIMYIRTLNVDSNLTTDPEPRLMLGMSNPNFACLVKFNSNGIFQWKQTFTCGIANFRTQEISVVNNTLYLTLRIQAGPFSCNGVASFLTASNGGTILLQGTTDGVFTLLSYTVV